MQERHSQTTRLSCSIEIAVDGAPFSHVVLSRILKSVKNREDCGEVVHRTEFVGEVVEEVIEE